MNEVIPTGAGLVAAIPGSTEEVLVQAGRLLRASQAGVPGWIAEDLTFGQLRLLFWLCGQGPTSMSRLGEWSTTGPSAVTGAVERLEQHGLLARAHRVDDRRIVEVGLTEAGRNLLDAIRGFRVEAIRRFLGVLEPAELAELDRLMRLVIERTAGTQA